MYNKPEPNPIKNDNVAVWDLVIQDMKDRDNTGLEKYGTRLQPFNGRNSLIDAYQEVLDLAVYLRQTIYEEGLVVSEETTTVLDELSNRVIQIVYWVGVIFSSAFFFVRLLPEGGNLIEVLVCVVFSLLCGLTSWFGFAIQLAELLI